MFKDGLNLGSYWVVAPDLKGFGDSEKPFLANNYKDDVILEVNYIGSRLKLRSCVSFPAEGIS